MPTTVQFRRGTTAQNDAFTGSEGELSIDTDLNVLRVHDGSTQGGFALPKKTSWETKTTNFNIEADGHYFADVREGAIVGTLPSSPSVGDEFRIVVIGEALSNNFKLSRNGERIQGELSNLVVTTANAGFGLVYASSNTGWRLLEV